MIRVALSTCGGSVIGFSQRRGCGHVRKLERPSLQTQKTVKDNKFGTRCPRKFNRTDIFTEHVDCNTMMKLLDMMGIKLTTEKHATTFVAILRYPSRRYVFLLRVLEVGTDDGRSCEGC